MEVANMLAISFHLPSLLLCKKYNKSTNKDNGQIFAYELGTSQTIDHYQNKERLSETDDHPRTSQSSSLLPQKRCQGHLLRTCHQDGAQLCAQLLVYGEAAGVSGGMDASRRLHSEFC